MFRRDAFPISRHDNDVDFALHEISDEIADQLVAAGGQTSFEDDVVAFDVSELAQLLKERTKDNGSPGSAPMETRPTLGTGEACCARGERPRSRTTQNAEKKLRRLMQTIKSQDQAIVTT
jgi:hypothetical protein